MALRDALSAFPPATMTRRIVRSYPQIPRRTNLLTTSYKIRTTFQLFGVLACLLFLVFVLDNHYRVLPENLHEYSPVHHSGLVVVDITVTTCSSLSLLSSCKLGDEWDRIEKDLYLSHGWVSHAYVHVRRKKEEALVEGDRVVVDVKISRKDPSSGHKGPEKQKWEARPSGLWLRRSSKRHASDSQTVISDVDVLFGPDAVDPRPGWEIKDRGLRLGGDRNQIEARLTVRKGHPKDPVRPTPRIRKDGKFKILQVSDMHLSTGVGVCRDPVLPEDAPPGACEADSRTLELVGEALDHEKPDLVVVSGDVVNGETAPDSATALFKAAELFARRNMPWALILGNHDDSGSLSRMALMHLAETLPLSLAQPGPATVDGVGNYVVEVLAARGTSHHSALTLYLLDTHSYSPDEARYPGYDWLKASQLAWFRETARDLRASAAHKDYAHRHLDMAFIHIPLPEYAGMPKVDGSGAFLEPVTAPRFNAGFKDVLVENGILAVSAGHDHANDACVVAGHSAPNDVPGELGEDAKSRAEKGKVWMCYAGGSGYGGYGGYGGYKRRVRVWDFDMNEGHIETWKRIDGEEGRKDIKKVAVSGQVVSG